MRKILLITLLVLISAAGVVWWLLADANRYKPQIVELIQSHTGLTVTIRGNLKWRLWPPVQLVAEDVTADWTAQPAQPLLSAHELRLDADILPLLSRNPKLAIQGIAINGLRAHLVEHGTTANWMPPGQKGTPVPPLPIPPPRAADPATPWLVDRFTLDDAVIDYTRDDESTQITIDALQMKGIAPTRRFPLHAKLVVKDAQLEIPLTVAAALTFDAGVAKWQIDDIDINGAYGNPGPSFRLTGTAHLNTAAGTADLQNAHLDLGKVSATFDVAAVDLLKSPQVNGHLDLPQQSLDSVAATFGTHLDVPVGVKAAFTATADRVDLANAELRYGAALVTGKIGATLTNRPHISFDLATDRFIVPSSRTAVASLGAGSFATVAFAAPPVSVDPSLDEALLPLEAIRTNDWDGKLAIGELVQDGATFRNATIASSNAAGVSNTAINLPHFFGGTASTQLKIDANGNAPQWTLTPKMDHVDSQALMAWLGEKYDWIASILASGEMSMRGNTARELISSLTGHTTFDGGQGIINVAQIKDAALAVAKIAGGTDKVEKWPDRLKYKRFTGVWDTKGQQQSIDVALDNLTLKAQGKVDLLADDMDLRATVTVNDDPKYASFKVNSTMTGLPLPIRCKGSIASPRCGADEDGTRQLVARALSGQDPEMKKKLDKAIDEKVPAEYRDAARSLLEMLNKGNHSKPKSP